MKANFKLNKDEEQQKEKTSAEVEKKEITDEEFLKKGMNVWTFRSKSRLNMK